MVGSRLVGDETLQTFSTRRFTPVEKSFPMSPLNLAIAAEEGGRNNAKTLLIAQSLSAGYLIFVRLRAARKRLRFVPPLTMPNAGAATME
jgi:uncharacterized membrane protein (UPF0136 family)